MTTTSPVAVIFEHILVPTDFSDIAEKALEYAKALAKPGNAELLLVHVEPPFSPITPAEAEWIDNAEIEAMREKQMEQRGATLVCEGYRAKTFLLIGSLYDELVSTVTDHHVDLIVLGTHGRKGVDRFLMGSDAEAMLRRAKCPVLSVGTAVPEIHKTPWSIGEIVCATTFHVKAAEVAAYAYKLAAQYRAKLTFFHVTNPTVNEDLDWMAFQQALRQYVPEGAGQDCLQTRVPHAGAASSITEFACERGANLIVMGANAANSIVTHFTPGAVAKVLMESHCPVLTLMHG